MVGTIVTMVEAAMAGSRRMGVLVVDHPEVGSRRQLLARRLGRGPRGVLLVVVWRAALMHRCLDRMGGLRVRRVKVDSGRR